MPSYGASGFVWRKSTRSQQNGACVEIAHLGVSVAVRDSKTLDSAFLACSSTEWAAFVHGIKSGWFGLSSRS
ncbi:DUF397 domain-containing protein [Sphaerisporangium sp. B11E5]|uniref:DUF397 domain-containing protein n=1 Tax=Sphaerisporangium sp. B11E5 TaxID=3153563 RepID=UPI00325E5754